MTQSRLSALRFRLLDWYAKNKRTLPWRRPGLSPYAVWVSEIMLQQTRVETVIPYYETWLRLFPTVQALASASEQEVLNAWEGLGYYSRARNFHKAAQMVVHDYGGQLPRDLGRNAQTFDGKDTESYWMGTRRGNETYNSTPTNPPPHVGGYKSQGVDLYVGGTEHAVLHLLYARFWHKVLFDLGYVSTPEPFFKLVNQGLILGEDGQKMSKSRGNTVNPDDILTEFGADAFRLYEMFIDPLQHTKPWNTRGVEGVYRFLGRVWRLFVDEASETEFEQTETTTETQRRGELLDLIKLHTAIKDTPPTPAQLKTLHACIKKVTEDLDGMRFNTAISR